MKNTIAITIAAAALLLSCGSEDVLSSIDPFIGSDGTGHCMPCATTPFGMIQVGPQSGNGKWDYTGGYQYRDTVLWGFNQNRVNGTGSSDLGDLLMFPYCGKWERSDYYSLYDKSSEKASPGWYEVTLTEAGVRAAMSATPHCSIMEFTFNDPSTARLMIDYQSGTSSHEESIPIHVIEAEQHYDNQYMITGKAHVKMWIDRWYYYAICTDTPYSVEEVLPPRDPREMARRVVYSFSIPEGKKVTVKVSISRTSTDDAVANIMSEIPGWDIAAVREQARGQWRDLVSRVEVDGSEADRMNIYGALYRLFMQPHDVGNASGPARYSTFSLWDTYRAAHPLYTILAPEMAEKFIDSMLAEYDEEGHLPIWSLWGQENWGMIGDHAVPVVVDAFLKGLRGNDPERVYEAVKKSLTVPLPKTDWNLYDKYGYFPFDKVIVESASRTLECCYDDWCAAQMAKALGHDADYEFFIKRSGYWRNLMDPDSRLVRGRDSEGNWRTPFDKFKPAHWKTGGDYTEGNAWQYTWHVQHDVDGLIDFMGGREAFCTKLDSLFSLGNDMIDSSVSVDVTGLIGQYAHGNEPSHHVIYLYAMAGQPHKTAELVREICDTQYKPTPDGLSGNDDCGQMSAWYLFSAMGFYPVNPCGGDYVIGAPQVKGMKWHLPGGKTFEMEAVGISPENKYVQRVTLNGKEIEDGIIRHSDIMSGGKLTFYMSNTYIH